MPLSEVMLYLILATSAIGAVIAIWVEIQDRNRRKKKK